MTGKKNLLFALLLPLYALGQATFTNPQPIVIPDSDPPPVPATPYPSEINVTGLEGSAYSVQVILHRFTHTFPAAADLLLVAPDGTSLVLLSDAGGAGDVNGLELRFSDSAAGSIAANGATGSGVYKPSNYGGGDQWPLPAPPPTGASTLSVFNGTPPNGTWRLYVVNDVDGTLGTIEGGWTLRFFTQFSSLALTLPAPSVKLDASGQRVEVKWTGSNSLRWVDVEWSANGTQWRPAGRWTKEGTAFYHQPPVGGTLYYRLRHNSRTSAAVTVEVPHTSMLVRWGRSALLLPQGTGLTGGLQLTDLQGRPHFRAQLAPGIKEIDLPVLPAGVYVLHVNGNARLIRI